jgi:hypothetical protein
LPTALARPIALSFPSVYHVLTDPERDRTSLDKASIVRSPIPNAVLGFGLAP